MTTEQARRQAERDAYWAAHEERLLRNRRKPLLLDTYCCEGGASEGYRRAGFDVIGVDLFRHQDHTGKTVGFSRNRYPFPAIQGDALYVLRRLGQGHTLRADDGRAFSRRDVTAIHASPPCQHASAGTRAMRSQGDTRHEALIEPTRDLLRELDVPYVIENVKGAALHDPVTLCWSMFYLAGFHKDEDGVPLRMERHRLFETNWPLIAPVPIGGSVSGCFHPANVQVAGSYGAAQRTIAGAKKRGGGYVPSKAVQQQLLGIDWMTERGMHQSLPPVYTEEIGLQLLQHVRREAMA